MQGYSPYQNQQKRSSSKFNFKFKLPEFSSGARKWIFIILGIFLGLFFIVYLSFGELRVFANNYLRLTFFSKNYIVLLQNNYELRPGGGFITGYGNFKTFMGFPTELSFHNSYDIGATDEYITPPFPHEKMLKNEWYEGYTFRDANWSPDFRGSTNDLIKFYKQKFPKKDVDGIIVVNFSLIENMIEKLGGIKVGEKELNKKNLFSTLEFEVNNIDRHNEDELSERKGILNELSSSLIKKAKWHPFKSKEIIISSLKNKDIYMWFQSNGMQRKMEDRGWGNTFQKPEKNDFLSVNIANLGAKKADRYMLKEVHHYVNISNEIPEITTEVTIRYPGNKNAYADDYKGYLQLTVPGKADITNYPVDSNIEGNEDFKTVGTEIIMPAGSKMSLAYTYTLPRTFLEKDEYELNIIKQSGDNKLYRITVETPADTLIESEDFKVKENRGMFTEIINSDRILNLKVLADTMPPYPIEQVFENLKTIVIYWNEPMDQEIGNNASNYRITDSNLISETTDEIIVNYAEMIAPNISKLELEGITEQKLERYKIELKDLRDLAGNLIQSNPKIITAVQRFNEQPKTELSTDEESDGIFNVLQ